MKLQNQIYETTDEVFLTKGSSIYKEAMHKIQGGTFKS